MFLPVSSERGGDWVTGATHTTAHTHRSHTLVPESGGLSFIYNTEVKHKHTNTNTCFYTLNKTRGVSIPGEAESEHPTDNAALD